MDVSGIGVLEKQERKEFCFALLVRTAAVSAQDAANCLVRKVWQQIVYDIAGRVIEHDVRDLMKDDQYLMKAGSMLSVVDDVPVGSFYPEADVAWPRILGELDRTPALRFQALDEIAQRERRAQLKRRK